jgi:hypothetical protein
LSCIRNPTCVRPIKVRTHTICRGLRAWRAWKVTHETGEALGVPAALTTRAKQVRTRKIKQRVLKTLRESDWLIVRRKRRKGPTR